MEGFKNLVPIMKNELVLPLLYNLNNQVELEKFLNERNFSLSIEEVERLWDIIEACKLSDFNQQKGMVLSDNDELNKHNSKNSEYIEDEGLNVSGGVKDFVDKMLKKASNIINKIDNLD